MNSPAFLSLINIASPFSLPIVAGASTVERGTISLLKILNESSLRLLPFDIQKPNENIHLFVINDVTWFGKCYDVTRRRLHKFEQTPVIVGNQNFDSSNTSSVRRWDTLNCCSGILFLFKICRAHPQLTFLFHSESENCFKCLLSVQHTEEILME